MAPAHRRNGIEFWTGVLWRLDRVGDAASTSNGSVRGLLARAMAGDVTPWWLAVVGLLAAIWWHRVRRAAIRGDDLGAAATTGAFACLVFPITWIHHQVFLIPALAVLTRWALEPREFAVVRRAVAILVHLVLVLQLHEIAPKCVRRDRARAFRLLPCEERMVRPSSGSAIAMWCAFWHVRVPEAGRRE